MATAWFSSNDANLEMGRSAMAYDLRMALEELLRKIGAEDGYYPKTTRLSKPDSRAACANAGTSRSERSSS